MINGSNEWPKSGPTIRQQIEEGRRTANGGEVDWSKVPTERQETEWVTLRRVEELIARVESVGFDIGLDDIDEPDELTPSEVQKAVHDLAREVHALATLFREHLKVVDLDDAAKAIGVGRDA